jgi:hypothetical protein
LTLGAGDRQTLAKYRSANGSGGRSPNDFGGLKKSLQSQKLSGTAIKDAWFGGIEADVFLSHAHADRELALDLADFLRARCGIRTFVDYRVWGNSRELLRSIDEAHCWSEEDGFFVYSRRNYSTSHVHMMLATALSEMINRTECVIFLNTPSSIQAEDARKRSTECTASPWIYHEITMTRLIARRIHRAPPPLPPRYQVEARADAMDKAFQMEHEVSLDHLCDIDGQALFKWGRQTFPKHTDALNWLYREHRPTEDEWPALLQLTETWNAR